MMQLLNIKWLFTFTRAISWMASFYFYLSKQLLKYTIFRYSSILWIYLSRVNLTQDQIQKELLNKLPALQNDTDSESNFSVYVG